MLLLSNGTGSFSVAPDASLPPRVGGSDAGAVGIRTADFDKNGWPDIVAVGGGVMHILLENSNGEQFEVAQNISEDYRYGSGSPYPIFVAPGDLDGDGDVDFVLLYLNSTSQQVLVRE